ncbi:citrate/2-methylcitrate synthase [Actinoplanes sp. M2I2]|uniref:citrate/2-methylcitrate synthase n=1 Tax=Actinoplanes sp. M2I2 TaxID=1734444 RepID=UPI0020220A2E|nr:citrate/2-methylcitrate synthase [Actinoplanes sp. M2I2]
MDVDVPRLTTNDVARLLGVRPATVYAYVSRGLLGSHRNANGKGSLFDRAEVDAFLAARRRPTTPGIQTGITLIQHGTLYYRGLDAVQLARVASFEEVVTLLWTGTRAYVDFVPDESLRRLAEAVIAPLPEAARNTDRLRVIAAAAAAGDPLRFDTSPAAVTATGRTLLATMVAALPLPACPPAASPLAPHQPAGLPAGAPTTPASPAATSPATVPTAAASPATTSPAAMPTAAASSAALPVTAQRIATDPPAATQPLKAQNETPAKPKKNKALSDRVADESLTGRTASAHYEGSSAPFDPVERSGTKRIAERLWPRLTTREPAPRDHNLLDAALILLADHDIAASTLAARVAASTRAHPYAVVGAGLAALDGPLHGAASSFAYALLTETMTRPDPIDAIADKLRAGDPVPGFGHRLYPNGDPRAVALLDMLGDTRARDAAERVAHVMRTRSGLHPNVDLALAAITLEHNMPPDAGETIFAVARTAGWIAHALEEYADRPSRFRPSGEYAGRAPA